jgi:uncharacterized protein YndB with AHSA1/START domain
MKRHRKWLLGLTALALVPSFLLIVSGSTPAAEAKLELEHRVDAPAMELYELMTSYEGIERWWQHANEAMGEQFEVRHLGGPAAGVGMQIGFAFPDGDVFEHWTFTQVEPFSKIRMDVDFLIGVVFDRTLALSSDGTGTLVRWVESGQVEDETMREMLNENRSSAIENRRTVLDAAGVAATD